MKTKPKAKVSLIDFSAALNDVKAKCEARFAEMAKDAVFAQKIKAAVAQEVGNCITHEIAIIKSKLPDQTTTLSRIREHAKHLMATCNFHPSSKFALIVFEDIEFVVEFSNNHYEVKEIAHADYLKALNDAQIN